MATKTMEDIPQLQLEMATSSEEINNLTICQLVDIPEAMIQGENYEANHYSYANTHESTPKNRRLSHTRKVATPMVDSGLRRSLLINPGKDQVKHVHLEHTPRKKCKPNKTLEEDTRTEVQVPTT